MKLKKLLTFMFILLTSILLVACVKELDNIDDVVLTKDDLSKALRNLSNNYQLDVEIMFYNEKEADVVIKVDNEKTYYKEGVQTELYYVRDNRDITIYEKKGNKFVVTNEREIKNRDYDIFENIDHEWFDLIDNKFVLKEENSQQLLELFKLDDLITLKSAEIIINNDLSFKSFKIVFEEDRDPYYFTINISNIGTTSITLPEVD